MLVSTGFGKHFPSLAIHYLAVDILVEQGYSRLERTQRKWERPFCSEGLALFTSLLSFFYIKKLVRYPPSTSSTFSNCHSPLEGWVQGSLKSLVTKINSGRALKLCVHTEKNTKETACSGGNNDLSTQPVVTL